MGRSGSATEERPEQRSPVHREADEVEDLVAGRMNYFDLELTFGKEVFEAGFYIVRLPESKIAPSGTNNEFFAHTPVANERCTSGLRAMESASLRALSAA